MVNSSAERRWFFFPFVEKPIIFDLETCLGRSSVALRLGEGWGGGLTDLLELNLDDLLLISPSLLLEEEERFDRQNMRATISITMMLMSTKDAAETATAMINTVESLSSSVVGV